MVAFKIQSTRQSHYIVFWWSGIRVRIQTQTRQSKTRGRAGGSRTEDVEVLFLELKELTERGINPSEGQLILTDIEINQGNTGCAIFRGG